MPEVIVINGPPGVGKSSITAQLRTPCRGRSPFPAHSYAPSLRPTRARTSVAARRTASRARWLLPSCNSKRVLFEYEFLRASHLAYFRDALNVPAELHVFTLWAPLESLAERSSGPPSARGHGLELADSYREMAMNLGKLGQIIETARLSCEEIARHIHERLPNS